ncbi:MAG: hypothetical protein CVU07_11075 [Bacteroidetes bacterium HGW-Bacteroidetes-23]|nr:MAG: hypothetical protein CVU07_11075 [Bacteroidetes bacterium HGW-Bacteroidetes-23]
MSPFTDFFNKLGEKIGTDGVDDGVKVVVINQDKAKKISKIEGEVNILDDNLDIKPSDIVALPNDRTLREGLNVLDRTEKNGGLKEESSRVGDNLIFASKTGEEAKISQDKEGNNVAIAESNQEALSLPRGSKITSSIHSHPTVALEKGNDIFPFSTEEPSPQDKTSFKNQSVNIIAGRIGGKEGLSRDSTGKLVDSRETGISIFNSKSVLQITLSKDVLKSILSN